MSSGRGGDDRDGAGRFRPGAPSPNPRGRPRKVHGVDAAILSALNQKLSVIDQGKRKNKTKLELNALKAANEGIAGNLRATKMVFDEARKAEARAEAQAVRAPIMTQSDHEIAARFIARLKKLMSEGNLHDHPDS